MHQLTSDGAYELRIDLEDWEGEKAYALYAYFEIANDVAPYYLYKLTAAYYAGTAGIFDMHFLKFYQSKEFAINHYLLFRRLVGTAQRNAVLDL